MEAKAEVRVALGGISEWFDEYIANEESDAAQVKQHRICCICHNLM